MAAVTGTFHFVDYRATETGWEFHFLNFNPGPGMANDWYTYALYSEVPENMSANSLRTMLENKLRLAHGTGHPALNNFVGQTILQ